MLNSQNNFLSSIPTVTRNILIINFIIWLACFVLARSNFDLSNLLGLHFPTSQGFYLFQIITYMFTQVAFSHFFFNMFAVFMFGGSLENMWGPKKFLTYYLVTGIGAGLIQLLVCYLRMKSISMDLPDGVFEVVRTEGYNLLQQNMNYTDPLMSNLNSLFNSVTIGASGSVFGLLLAFGMLFPNAPIYVMLIPIPIKAKYFVIGYGLVELYLGFANRSGDNVAHFAHLGGMIFGILLILYWKNKDKKNGNFYQQY